MLIRNPGHIKESIPGFEREAVAKSIYAGSWMNAIWFSEYNISLDGQKMPRRTNGDIQKDWKYFFDFEYF